MGDNGQPAAPPAGDTGFLLEHAKRFSESVLWQINRQYYSDVGPQAWHSGAVPSYATCNAYIAQAYANVVIAYLRDAVAAGLVDPAHPVHIVELAAGVGRFAYQVLKKVHALKVASPLRALGGRDVRTDLTRAHRRPWSRPPQHRPLRAS